jgi:hypothetical protein
MQISDMLAQTGGLRSIAKELGISETQATSGAAALAPAILGGFKKQAHTQPGGVAGLSSLIGQLGGGGLLEDVLAPHPTTLERGNDVLGHIFGSKEVSRTVAQDAAAKTGLSPDLLKKMLPMLTMLVAGYIAKQRSDAGETPAPDAPTENAHGGLLGGLRGGGAAGAQRAGTGGIASMLDSDGDGNVLDDILRRLR